MIKKWPKMVKMTKKLPPKGQYCPFLVKITNLARPVWAAPKSKKKNEKIKMKIKFIYIFLSTGPRADRLKVENWKIFENFWVVKDQIFRKMEKFSIYKNWEIFADPAHARGAPWSRRRQAALISRRLGGERHLFGHFWRLLVAKNGKNDHLVPNFG